ncbi:MAG: sulfatase-like hydrolase/transferase [Fimbriimonadaceae bacterium]|nr:sulfatase-like hydrolase/transferase [Fimbriimonadaceae bacterium]
MKRVPLLLAAALTVPLNLQAADALWLGAHAAPLGRPAVQTKNRPNILLIYADDLGYGDVGFNGATAVKTPNVDRLATEGLRFNNGYCSSSTCTPSRFSMLTGEYAFRQKGTGVLPGDAKLIIPTDRATLPSILKKAGYATGIVGKWHLGLGAGKEELDWNAEIKPGPREVGFEYSFIMAATGDRVPCVFIENQRIVGLEASDPIEVSYGKTPYPGEPNGVSERDQLKMDWSEGHNMAVVNGIGRIGYMKGGKAALWKDEDMADTFTRKGVEFIESHKDKPFFLYFATHDIHVPRVPNARFVGKTTMGPRGDAIVQFDACVGELLAALDRLHLSEDTLVIFTSDNGPVLDDGYKDDAVEKLGNHKPAGPFRGGKYSIYEGGTRMPFVVRWPGRVTPGVSEAIVSQVDFCASFAALAGLKLGPEDAPDSINVMPALLGDSRTGRDHVLMHSGIVAIRHGKWKNVPGRPAANGPNAPRARDEELYDLERDLSESTNVAAQHPDVAARLSKELDQLRARGE